MAKINNIMLQIIITNHDIYLVWKYNLYLKFFFYFLIELYMLKLCNRIFDSDMIEYNT